MSDTAEERRPTPTGALLVALGGSHLEGDWREHFAEVFSKTRSISRACEVVGIHRQALAKLLEDDDQLRNAVTAVQEKITDDLEAIAIERAATTGQAARVPAQGPPARRLRGQEGRDHDPSGAAVRPRRGE